MMSAQSSTVLRRRVLAITRGTGGISSRMASATAPGEPSAATASSSVMPSSMRSAMASA